jgi:tetratricopeptide (TPR) repeat protein
LPAVAAAAGSVQVAATEPGLWLSDPIAGDRLLVFPDRADAALPRSTGSFPDLELLPSLAGIVVQPLRPDLVTEPAPDGMVLRRMSGRPLVQAGSALPDQLSHPMPRLDFVRFGSTVLRDARRAAEAELAALPDDPLRQAELIRTLLAGNLAEEARIVIARSMHPDATVRALSAVTDALIDPLHADIAPFSEMGRADDEETALWRSYLLASRGQHAEAMRSHRRSGDRLRHYPPALRVALAPAIVGALLDQDRPSAALAVLDGLLAETSEPREIALLKLLQGRALASEEAIEQARAKLAEAATTEDRDVALAAHGDGLDLDLESGIMAPDAANAELAGMALAWEGSTEQRAMELRRARIAAQAGDWQAAMTAAERAASLQADPTPNPSSPLVELLEQALSAPDLSPFERLSLLQNRPIALVRVPSIAGQVASLVRDLMALGASETARSLAHSAEIPPDHVPSPSSESASPSSYENDETTRTLLSMAAEPDRLLPDQAAQLSRLLEKLSMN